MVILVYEEGKVEKKLEDIELNQLLEVLSGDYDDLLERLPLQQLLTLKHQKNWRKELKELVEMSNTNLQKHLDEIKQIEKDIKKIEDSKRMNQYMKEILLANQYGELFSTYFSTDYPVIPISNELIYEYDFGDDWQVHIHLDHIYELNEGIVKDENDCVVEDEAIITAMNKNKLACLAADGLNVLDDVGNVGGYVAMLQTLHGEDGSDYGFEDVVSTKAWAKSQGWSGRVTIPKNIL